LTHILICVIVRALGGKDVKPKELLRRLASQGWYVDRVHGSHHIMKHPEKPGILMIPYHMKDLPPRTLNNILKQAGLK